MATVHAGWHGASQSIPTCSIGALSVSGERTKKAAVTRALEEFIARREQARILELFGQVEIDPSYDQKTERSRG